MSAIIIDGKLLHYETFGRGKPLIFLHGWLGSWRYWMPSMELMSEHGRTYALDLWGFGDSDHANGKYSVPQYVDLLEAFIEEMGIGSMTLIGHALGAAVAMHYAIKKPEHVARIMTISAPITGNTINRKLLSSETSFLDRVRGWKPTEGHAEVEQEMDKMAQDVIEASVRSSMDTDLQQMINQIQIPILLVHGERDTLVAPPQPNWLTDAGKNVRTILLPDIQHFPMLDETARFTRLLADFLEIDDKEELGALTIENTWRRRTH